MKVQGGVRFCYGFGVVGFMLLAEGVGGVGGDVIETVPPVCDGLSGES